MDESNPNYYLVPLARLILGLDYPKHFYDWGELLEKEKRLLLIASRDHGKTTLVDKVLPISRILRNKGYKILIVSYSDTQVLKITGEIKDAFEKNPHLKAFSPKSESDWSKSRMKFEDGSIIDALTFGSSGRGGHYDLILVDDPIKDFGGMNPDDQSQYFTRSLTPMCNPDGQIIVTGTYVYDDDLIDRIEKNKAYVTVKYPAINKDGEPLWPERWPLDKLEARRREIESSDDPFGFVKEYLLEKIDPKAQFFKREMFKFYDPDKLPERLSRAASWDPAYSLNGDFNAMMVTGTDENKKTYLFEEYAEFRSDDVQALVDEQFRLTELYQVPYWILETIGFQKLLKEHIYDKMRKENKHFGIKEIRHHMKSKQARIMALQPRIANGSLLFHPTAHKEVIDQFIAFPRGKNDDMIDAIASMLPDWDSPQPATVKAPQGSFEWWQKKAHEVQSKGWHEELTR